MSVLLAVMTCHTCSPTLLRHWSWFQRQKADYEYMITTDKPCECPPGVRTIRVPPDSYLNGPVLPERMCDTLASLLTVPWRTLVLAEYDVLILNRIPVEKMEGDIAAHLAGFQHSTMLAKCFYHTPWVFKRDAAIRFVDAGRRVIEEGVCSYGSPESSPDVFFGLVVEQYGLKIQTDIWSEYSRNSFDHPEHLVEARQAFRDGVDIIHGCKTEKELLYITG